jgi:hypothetical protein
VAELRPVPRAQLSTDALIRRWQSLPKVDPVKLRADIDSVLDSRL